MRFRAADPFLVLALGMLLSAPPARGAASFHRLEPDGTRVPVSVVLAPDVKDPYFGLLLGVLDADHYGRLDTAFLDSVFTAAGGSRIPYRTIRAMSREPAAPHEAPLHSRVYVQMDGPLKVPIPYSILGYNPGTLRSSETMTMWHYVLGDRTVLLAGDNEDGDEPPVEFHAADVHVFMLEQGSMEMDIDGWLDRLLGGKLDDVKLSGFAVFRDGEQRIGLGFGYSKKGKGRTGAFDFVLNESIFPASKTYLALGRELRRMGERHLEASRARGGATPPR